MRDGAWAMTMGFQPGYPISATAATRNDRREITVYPREIPAARQIRRRIVARSIP
jgi:hypothetical protein